MADGAKFEDLSKVRPLNYNINSPRDISDNQNTVNRSYYLQPSTYSLPILVHEDTQYYRCWGTISNCACMRLWPFTLPSPLHKGNLNLNVSENRCRYVPFLSNSINLRLTAWSKWTRTISRRLRISQKRKLGTFLRPTHTNTCFWTFLKKESHETTTQSQMNKQTRHSKPLINSGPTSKMLILR